MTYTRVEVAFEDGMNMTKEEIEKEAKKYVEGLQIDYPLHLNLAQAIKIQLIRTYIAGRTKGEEAYENDANKLMSEITRLRNLIEAKDKAQEMDFAFIEQLKLDLKTLRNSTIDECIEEAERLDDDGKFYCNLLIKLFNALKTV